MSNGDESNGDEDKRDVLYMISDSEGCMNDKNNQSTAMCDPKFFEHITNLMTNNNKMKFAFLGDYFDQGQRVYETIMGMMDLYNKFGKERVFIILGNRDVNKLRFMYELTHNVIPLTDPQDRWKDAWQKYYDGLPSFKDDSFGKVDHINHILETSMGAKKNIGITSFTPPEKRTTDVNDTALSYFNAAFNIGDSNENIKTDDKSPPPLDILEFYKMSMICHYDEGHNTFLSHAGGWYRDAFFNQKYIDYLLNDDTKEKNTEENNIVKTIDVDPKDYLSLMEKYRRALFDNTEMNDEHKAKKIKDSVDAYNKLLDDVVNELVILPNKPRVFSKKFVLLQALGLKPDSEDSKYRSVIQSCSQVVCSGTSPDNFNVTGEKHNNNIDDLFNLLIGSGVKYVSYGHKPICHYVPLIYQRQDSQNRKITFISNDTSNGNRYKEKLGEHIVTASSIEKKEDKFISKVEIIVTVVDPESTIKMNSILSTNKGLLGPFDENNSPPQYKTEKNETKLVYKDVIVTMNGKSNYNPLKLSDHSQSENATQTAADATQAAANTTNQGGKRRTVRKNKRRNITKRKNNKRKSNKRLRKTKYRR